MAAAYAPSASPAPVRTRHGPRRTAKARNAVVSADSSSARARWSSASRCRPWATARRGGHRAAPGHPPTCPGRNRARPAAAPSRPSQSPAPKSASALVDGQPGEVRVGRAEGGQLSPSARGRRAAHSRSPDAARGVGFPQRRVDEAPPVPSLGGACTPRAASAGPPGRSESGPHRRGAKRTRSPWVADGLRRLDRRRHRVLGVWLVGPERRPGRPLRGRTVLPRAGPGPRQSAGPPHRLDTQEAASGREAQVLHGAPAARRRAAAASPSSSRGEQGLDGAVLDLVVAGSRRGVPEPHQELDGRAPQHPRRGPAGRPAARAAPRQPGSVARAGRRARPRAGSSGTLRGRARPSSGAPATAEVAASPLGRRRASPSARSASHRL